MTRLECKWVIKVNQEIYGEIFCMDDDIIHWVQIRLVKKKLVCAYSVFYIVCIFLLFLITQLYFLIPHRK